MTSTKASLYRNPRFYVVPIVLLGILTLIGWIGLTVVPRRGLTRSTAWMLIMALMAAFAVVAGRSITGYWRGILIDNRFKIISASTQHDLPKATVLARYDNGERVILSTNRDPEPAVDHIICFEDAAQDLACGHEADLRED